MLKCFNTLKKLKPGIIPICVTILAMGLITRSEVVAAGIRDGLAVSAGTLIPSLFPFMVLCAVITSSGYGAALAKPLGVIWKHLLRVPDEAGAVVLLSLIGGYPVGARGISQLLKRGVIDKSTAERMLCFCVNCGPSFLITAVGVGMLLDKRLGVVLLISQTAATLVIGAAVSMRAKVPVAVAAPKPDEKGGAAFVRAVTGASSSMITVCAFAVLFSGLLALLSSTVLPSYLAAYTGISEGIVSAVTGGLFEVTSGCIAAVRLGGDVALLLISLCASFGGLSVIFQVMSFFERGEIKFTRFILARLAHMPLAAAIALTIRRYFLAELVQSAELAQEVFAPSQPFIAQTDSTVWVSVICLIGMGTILMFSTEKPLRKRRR